MISSLDSASEYFLANVERIQQTIAEANRDVSSGKKITVASDAPDEIGTLLQLRASQQRNSQIRTNLSLSQADASAADGALSSAIRLMDRALTFASQGASSFQTAAGRQSMAAEVQALEEEMVTCSQSAVEGRYLFSGGQTDIPAYTFDSGQLATNPVVKGGTATPPTYRVEDPVGGSFAASKNAQEIFDARDAGGPTGDNVFEALNHLRLALLGGDTATIAGTAASIKLASEHLNSVQAFYGMVENRIQDATNFANRYDVELQTRLSQIEDADTAGAALQMTQATTQLQAAFQMRARMPHTSLFDYLG